MNVREIRYPNWVYLGMNNGHWAHIFTGKRTADGEYTHEDQVFLLCGNAWMPDGTDYRYARPGDRQCEACKSLVGKFWRDIPSEQR